MNEHDKKALVEKIKNFKEAIDTANQMGLEDFIELANLLQQVAENL